ncbi:MAG: response regulator [Treponema sp.]|nr:response regulator [Treponema sp.]
MSEDKAEYTSENEIPDFSGKKILLAEDNDINIMVAKNFIEKTNANLTIAKSGREAFSEFLQSEKDNKPFDLIFMDIQMPEMDGYETTAAIRKHNEKHSNNVKIIAMTGNVTDSEIQRCKQCGMNDYIPKPVSSKILYKKASLLLGISKYISNNDKITEKPVKCEKKYHSISIPPDLHNKNIMVVDDNKLNVEILRIMVQKTGANVIEAEDGKEALEKYLASENAYFDLILMDIQMPVMDGNECSEKIRTSGRKDSKLPIIAISANAFPEDIEKSISSGINLHMSKPVNMKILHETLKEVFDKSN